MGDVLLYGTFFIALPAVMLAVRSLKRAADRRIRKALSDAYLDE